MSAAILTGAPRTTDTPHREVPTVYHVMISLALGLLVGADDPKKKDEVRGSWVVISVASDEVTYEGHGETFAFEGGKCVLKTADGVREHTYMLDASMKPATLDLHLHGDKNRTVYGIYEITQDGLLRICNSTEARPTGFTAKGKTTRLIVLKRSDERKAEPAAKQAGSPVVTGRVTLLGKPLTRGKITFHLDNDQFVGARIKDGEYTVERVPPGRWKVTVEGEGVPAKYASGEQSELTVEVHKEGLRQTVDLDLR
jgi:uncharacterized protein (TIGR03067 family)